MILKDLKKTYQGQVVLDLPLLEIPDGKIIAVYGHNGSGKSTLAKILARIIKTDDAKEILPGVKIGYMTQRPLAFKLSLRNNLLQNTDKNHTKQENAARAQMLLKALKLEGLADKNAARLSGGEMQRMSLARILMKDYDLLILDEPTAAVDADTVPLCEELILAYQKRTGCTILIITHAKEQARRLADSMLYLENGKTAEAKE